MPEVAYTPDPTPTPRQFPPSRHFGASRFQSRSPIAASGADFTQANLTLDGTFRTLDLSAVVPVGANAVQLHCTIIAAATDRDLFFKETGNTSSNTPFSGGRTQVANLSHDFDCLVPIKTPNGARTIQYLAESGLTISIYVVGWFY